MRVELMQLYHRKHESKEQQIQWDNNGNKWFVSYGTKIVKIDKNDKVFLSKNYWDYSRTTGLYRNQFLGEHIADTRKNIKSGLYTLTDL